MSETEASLGWLERFNQATAYYKAGRLDEAIEAFQAVLELDPADGPTHFNLAEILEARGRRAEALEAYQSFLGYASKEETRFVEEAHARIKAIKKLLGASPTTADQGPKAKLIEHFTSAMEFYKGGRLAEAAGEFQACLDIEPRDAVSHYNLAEVLEGQQRLPEASAAYTAFLDCAGPDEAMFVEQARTRIKAIAATLGPGAGPAPAGPTTHGPRAPKTIAPLKLPASGSSRVAWRPGEVIDGLFEVRSELGVGGFGAVHKVYHRGWGMELAVKSPLADLVLNRWALESFVQEANTWVGLGLHPHIVTCFFVRLMGVPRIFIEFMEGGSLAEWLWKGRVADLQTALDAAIQLARAMQYAHGRGLVHRDLKPGNCLMTPGGTLKVTDFGLAKVGEDRGAALEAPRGAKMAKVKGATLTGRMGTPEYMSPEQWERPREAGPLADIWAFGCILYELCCRRRPFDMLPDEPVDAFYARLLESGWSYPKPKGLAEELAGLIASCLNPEPAKRPADFKAIVAVLEAVYLRGARKAYPREAPKEPPLLADTLVNQGVSLADLARSDEALKLFDQALKIDPMHPGAIFDRGLLLTNQGQMEDSELIGRLAQSKRARPREWATSYLLGVAHLRRSDAEAARRELAEAAELSRDNPLVLKAKRQAEEGAFDGAADFFVALPRGAEGAGMGDAAFRGLMKRAEAALEAGRAEGAYATVLRARGVKGYENAAAALGFIRTLSAHGLRRGLKGGWPMRSYEGSGGARALAVSSDGQWLLSGHEDKTVKLWDAETGRLLRGFEGANGAVNSVGFASDGKTIVAASADGALRQWDTGSGKCLRTIPAHAGPAWAVCLTRSGTQALSAGADKEIHLWDLATGKRLRSFAGHEGAVRFLGKTLEGRRAVSVGEDKTLRVWELATGKCLISIRVGEQPVRALAVSPNGRRVLTAAADKTLTYWSLRTGESLNALPCTSVPSALCFTPDGRYAAAGGERGSLDILDVVSWDRAASFEEKKREAAALCFSLDGSLAYTAGADGLRSWELDWEFAFPEAKDWDEGARPFVEYFLSRRPSARSEEPLTADELRALLAELGRRGYGWLSPRGLGETLESVRRGGWDRAGARRETAAPPSQAWVVGLGMGGALLVAGLGIMLINSSKTTVSLAPPPLEAPQRAPAERPKDAPGGLPRPERAPGPQSPAPASSLDQLIVDPAMRRSETVVPPADEPQRPADPAKAKEDPCVLESHGIMVDQIMPWDGGFQATVNGRKVSAGALVGRQSIVTEIGRNSVRFECMPSSKEARTAAFMMKRQNRNITHGRPFTKRL